MFRLIVFSVLLATVICGAVEAQDEGLGVGIIVGEPTGLCGKLWLSSRTAIDGAAAWSFNKSGNLHLHADYLIHSLDSNLGFYYGIGGRVKLDDDMRTGLRLPLGVTYITESSIDIFFELAPLLDLAPSTDFRLNAAIGLRYFL
ncbi:hypothetical protein ACFL6S_14010 [Candidatus Poribacteria bacterium]